MTRRVLQLGAHMSIASGLHRACDRAAALGCTTMQIFTKNASQWRAAAVTAAAAREFRAAAAAHGVDPVLAHTAYLINLASTDDATRARSVAALTDEIDRAGLLGIPYLVLHPGAHGGAGEEAGLAAVARGLDRALTAAATDAVMILLETTAGQGTCLGHRFAHLAALRAQSRYPDRLGICLDTCHVFAAGYDISTVAGVRRTLAVFDREVGLRQLRALHLNDALKPCGSRVDRHTHIGEGHIGDAGFRALLAQARVRALPMLLETPKGDDDEMDRCNLNRLRQLGG